MTNPLAELGTNRLYIAKVENTHCAPQSEETLADLAGPGCVKSLWMALGGGNNPALDGRIRVYYDGSPSPAIDIDVGTLFATHWGAGSAYGSHSTRHMHVEINAANYNTGLLLGFPMPFGAHIRITYYNPAPAGGQTAWVYSMVNYARTATDEANGRRLGCAGVRWMDQAWPRGSTDECTLLYNQGAGSVVWFSQVGGVGANNLSWLERNMAFWIDGEQSPSIEATGTEDWFDSAWYFNGWKDYSTSVHSYVGTDQRDDLGQPNVVGMATDLWSKWRGVPYNTYCVLKARSEPACNTGDSFCYAVLYYQ